MNISGKIIGGKIIDVRQCQIHCKAKKDISGHVWMIHIKQR